MEHIVDETPSSITYSYVREGCQTQLRKWIRLRTLTVWKAERVLFSFLRKQQQKKRKCK